jgi:4-amino-4-deoxy-L-arabinose transferase-like glycosyltransferase
LNWKSIKSELRCLFFLENDSRWTYALLGLVTLIAIALRALLVNQPVQYDEAYTFIHYASRSLTTILANYSAPNNHIFHTLLVAGTCRLFGASLWTLRLPALLAGVLTVPAAFMAARRFFTRNQSLAAAAVIAVTPVFIEYSANGRGYTLIIFFSLLLANFAGLLLEKQTTPALAAYGLTAALGFFTIPIFLYPMAGISLWLFASYLTESGPWSMRLRRLTVFLVTCALAGVLTFLLYSPVIFFGTGLDSLISNEIVESQNWLTFVNNLSPRLTNTAILWMTGFAPLFRGLLLVGFLFSLFFYRKVSNQRLPFQVFLVLAIASLMLIQRVVPLPRVWLFLEAFYLLFAAAGLAWFADLILQKIFSVRVKEAILASVIVLVPIAYVIFSIENSHFAIVRANDSPEEFAANYILENIQPDDTIIAVPPTDIQTAYYLVINGVPFDRFFQPDHPADMQNALVLVRTNSKYDTPKSILQYFDLTRDFLLARAKLVYEYGPLQVYSIPAR